MVRTAYDTTGAFLIAPILILVSYPIIRRAQRREEDGVVRTILMLALVVKFGATMVRYYVITDVYQGVADAVGYHSHGKDAARLLRSLTFDLGFPTYTGTWFLRLITGVVYAVTGPTFSGGFVVFSWLAFWGLFLWYRAFKVAVPQGSARLYAMGVLLAPSLLFWPSSIGKEAWITFALGIAAYGLARALSGALVRGSLLLGLGLSMAGIVRPHVAALFALAATAAFIWARSDRSAGRGAMVKLVGIPVVLCLVGLFALQAQTFFNLDNLSADSVVGVAATTTERSSQGGSEFEASVALASPVRAPVGVFSVLFRPLPFEANNLQMLITGIEATLLLCLVIVRLPSVVRAIRYGRRIPFLAFAMAYTLCFGIAFSSIGNFGILARQRVQVLPALLAIITLPSLKPAPERTPDPEPEADLVHVG